MRNWIKFVKKHHEVEVITDDKIKLSKIGINKDYRYLDHIVTAYEGFYRVDEYFNDTGEYITSWEENSIKEYLGY